MATITFPLQLVRDDDRPSSGAILDGGKPRRSNPIGTDVCDCGQMITAPGKASYSPIAVVNEWHCAGCGRSWTTYAATDATQTGA
jgi:hypothetical protein